MDRATPWDGRDDVVSRDMASVDWSSTPLGAPRDWAPELRAVVQVLLSSRFPMWMAWGPELTMLYNDGYRRDTLRDKHPWALGRPSDQVWAEVWDDVTPQVRAVLDEGRSTWDEDLLLLLRRRGWPEETFHTFSYSPLADGTGAVRGLLCVVAETTERVLGQRRMTFLRDLTAATTGVRSTPGVLRAARAVLADDPRDLPVGLLYLTEPDAPGRARLVADVGVTRGGPAAPAVVDLDATDDGTWPLARAREGTLELAPPPVLARELPPGCDRVALVALVAPEGLEGGLLGVLVLGLSRHLAFDRSYRDFVELVGGQVTSAVLEARAIESEHERAEALAELDRTRRRFFADASHELRTPLTLIQAPLAGLLADPDGDPAQRRTELEVAARNARRLTRLVGDLLEISRLHDGAAGPSRVAVDLGRLTAEVAATVDSAMARAGLEYVVEVPDEGPVATVDPRGWERIVGNLVANALKHTPAGRVTVRLATAGDEVVLTVTDTGVGVPADDLPHLFERFRRVEGTWARTAEGSGIGLALVADLAADHGGRVAVTSATTGSVPGSTFTVALPAGAAAGAVDLEASRAGDRSRALAEEAASWVPQTPSPDGPVETASVVEEPVGRVLVVDDNADMRAYMTRLLAPRATVHTAGDGDTALEAALADPPDMVVSDVMMPGRDGLSLLAALRADPRTARVPVLLVSARAGEEAAVAGLAAQADDYLVKPFAPGELQARVLAHLQLGRARREAEARFVAVADLAPAMIWVADEDGSRVFLNAAWTRFTGRVKDDDLGDGWLDRVHADDRAGYDALRDRARSLGRGWETDVRLRHADGSYHRVVEQAVVLLGPSGGGPGGRVGSCVDVQSRLRQADRSRLLAEVGVAMGSSETVEGRLLELRRVLAEARLADRVLLLPADAPEPTDGQGARRRRPLVVRGRTLRVLELERDPATAPWTADDDALIDEVVERTVPALDNALLRADERVAAERLALVQRTTASLSAAASPIDVARAVVTHVGELLGPATLCAVFEFDAPSRELRMLVRRPQARDERSNGDLVGLDTDTLLTRAVRTERPVWVHEPADGSDDGDGQDASLVALMRARGLREVVTIPLIAAGRVVGAVAVAPDGDATLDAGERTTLVALAEPCGVALDRARLYRAEHEIAQTLQRSLLPQDLPDVARLPIAVRYLPGAVGTSAGGDWYDVVEIDERRVGIVVGDVVGQGTAAAAVMGQLRASLSGYLLAGRGPAAALDLLDLLVARVPGARASTAICVVVDVESGEVRWSRAGHLPALLSDGSPRLLSGPEGHGPLLGLGRLRRVERTEGVVTITPGTSLVLYTDGLVERRGESLDEGLDRLVAVAGAVPDRPPEVLAAGLIAELAPTVAVDDVAVVVMRLAPPPLVDRLPAEPTRLAVLRRAVRDWSRRAGLADDVVEDLQLALGEAATNAVEHAYGRRPPPGATFSVRLTARPAGAVAAEVTDEGAWRETPREPGHRGRGLTMIRALATDVVVEGGPEGTRVSFTVPVVRDRRPAGTPAPWSTGSSDGRDSASRR